MQRRIFIKQASLTTIGVLLSTHIIGCNKGLLQLDELIYKKDDLVIDYPLEGNSSFGYRIIPKGVFRHSILDGNEAYIYSRNKNIIGVTIKKNGQENFTALKKIITDKYGIGKECYKNPYGESYEWKISDKKLILEYSNGRNNTPASISFSEILASSNITIY